MLVSILKILFALFYSGLMGGLELLLIPFGLTGKLFHAIAKLHARGVLAVSGVTVEVEGFERLKFPGSYIYVSNHASMFDIPAIRVFLVESRESDCSATPRASSAG